MKERSGLPHIVSKFCNEIFVQFVKGIELVVLTPLNKMVLLSESIIICWILLSICYSIRMYQHTFG